MRRALLAGCLAATASLVLAMPAWSEEIVLKFVTLDSPQAHLNVRVHHPWAEKINKEAKGLFRIDVRDGAALANHGNVYQRVLDDVAQIGWGLPLLVSGKFTHTSVVGLPYLSDNSEVASVALWRLYKTGLLDQDFDQIVPLKLIVFPQSGVQYREKPKTLDDFTGLKVIAGSKTSADIVKAMGGAPLSLRIDEYYEALQRGTADCVIVGWTAFQPFKLAEVTHYHLSAPLGSSPGYVFMAKKKWNSLPEAVKKILIANSGENESRSFGQFWDEVVKEGREQTMKQPGHTILKLTEAQDKAWNERLGAISHEWTQSVSNGGKILATYRELLGKVKAGS
jgi:TRAP-type transport system periplasmic protein